MVDIVSSEVAAPAPARKTKTPPANRFEVRVRMTVSRVINVSLVEQTFTAEVQMEASWIDSRIAVAVAEKNTHDATTLTVQGLNPDLETTDQKAGRLCFTELPGESFFAPRLVFRNCIDDGRSEQWFALFHDGDVDAPAVVCLRWNLTGVFQEMLELKLFPMDVQVPLQLL